LASGSSCDGVVHRLNRNGILIRAVEGPVERGQVGIGAAEHDPIRFQNELNPVSRLVNVDAGIVLPVF